MEALDIIETAKVMPKGQITIPKEIRDRMGIKPGSRVGFVVDGKVIRLVNPAIYAMEYMQEQMKEFANQYTDEEIVAWIKDIRKEIHK